MASKVRREFSIPNDTRYLSIVRRTVMEVIGEAGFPDDEVNMLTVAVDEAVANVIEHAFDPGEYGETTIDIEMSADSEAFEAVIRDNGGTFDQTAVPVVDIKEHVRSGKKNGLGVFLMKKIMDRVVYSHDDRSFNQLRLVKYANGEGKGKPGERGSPPRSQPN